MATVDKNFKVKNGLVVEGTTATVDGSDIITEDILTGGTQTNISVTYDAQAKTVSFVAENGVADSTTDDLTEGTSNLYYTDSRVKDVIDAAITNGTQTNITVTYDEETNALSFTAESSVEDIDTDDLAEGSVNLYFTDQRAVDAVINGAVDTDDIEEGSTNLYFTNQRALDATSAAYDVAGAAASAQSAAEDYADGVAATAQSNAESFATNSIDALDTDDIEEGSVNLYFTNSRAIDATSSSYDSIGSASTAEQNAKDYADGLATNYDAAGSAATAESNANDYTDTAISNLVDTAPETLDTLNELAAALGDDANFATTVANSIGEKVAKAGDTMTGELILSGDPTNELGAAPKQYVDQAEADAVSSANDYTNTAVATGDATATPIYQALNVNDVAKQVAATVSGFGTLPATAYSWAAANYRTAKFLVKVAYGTHTEVSEVLLTMDTSDNIAITEYAIVGTNGSLATVSASTDGTDVDLIVTPGSDATITVYGTLLV